MIEDYFEIVIFLSESDVKTDPLALETIENLSNQMFSAENYESSGFGSELNIKQENSEMKAERDSITKCEYQMKVNHYVLSHTKFSAPVQGYVSVHEWDNKGSSYPYKNFKRKFWNLFAIHLY